MKTLKNFLGLTLIFASVTSCGENDLPKYVNLGGLRVLALRAENGTAAEFSPGDTVTVRPLISDFGGGTRTLTYSAVACVDPGVSYGADPSCANVPGAATLASGNVTFGGGTVERTGEANSFTAAIPATILDGRSPVDQYNGVNYLVIYTVSAPDGVTVVSLKRLPVSLASKTKNQNPTLTNILSDGAALTTLPAAATAVGVSFVAGSIENYSSMKKSGDLEAKTEELVTTYFITDGELKYYRTVNDQTTTFTPAVPTGHTAAIVAVTRDDRGGVDFKVQGL